MLDTPASGNNYPHHLGGSITVFVTGTDHAVPPPAKREAGAEPANPNAAPVAGDTADNAAMDSGK